MNDPYIRQRINEILREKVAMGGCGNMMDYGGIVVGGKGKKGQTNPYSSYIGQVARDNHISLGQLIRDPKYKKLYKSAREEWHASKPPPEKRVRKTAAKKTAAKSKTASKKLYRTKRLPPRMTVRQLCEAYGFEKEKKKTR